MAAVSGACGIGRRNKRATHPLGMLRAFARVKRFSFVPVGLPPAPMMLFAIGVQFAHHVAM